MGNKGIKEKYNSYEIRSEHAKRHEIYGCDKTTNEVAVTVLAVPSRTLQQMVAVKYQHNVPKSYTECGLEQHPSVSLQVADLKLRVQRHLADIRKARSSLDCGDFLLHGLHDVCGDLLLDSARGLKSLAQCSEFVGEEILDCIASLRSSAEVAAGHLADGLSQSKHGLPPC